MNLKYSIKKDLNEGLRKHYFLIVLISILFFAIFNPVMNKMVMPELLKSQFPEMTEELINSMLDMTQFEVVINYLNDVFTLSLIAVVFTIGGILANEINEKTLILSVVSGKRFSEMIISKLAVYGTFLIISTTAGVLINYLYAGLLFGFDIDSLTKVILTGIMQGVYMTFVLSLSMAVGSMTKKGVITGLIVLIITYGMGLLGKLLNIDKFLPSGIVTMSARLDEIISTTSLISVAMTLGLTLLLCILTFYRLKQVELSKG